MKGQRGHGARWVARAITAASLGALAGCPSGVKGSGTAKTEPREVGAFSEVSVGGAMRVDITAGAKAQRVELTADDNLLPLITTTVKGTRLEVGTAKPIRPEVELRLKIAVEQLTALSLSGAANAEVAGVAGERFDLDLSGAGKVELAGEVEALDVDVSGAASVNAAKLAAARAKVDASGAASVTVRAAKSLEVNLSGVGKVAYYGSPEVKQDISGAGTVIKKGP